MPSNLYESFDEAAKAGNGSHIWKVDSPDGGCFWGNASTKRKAESLAAAGHDIANLQADIRVNGLTEDTDRNQCQRRIEVSTLNQMRGHFRSLLAQFGLTPKSKRGLASSDPTEPADPLDEL